MRDYPFMGPAEVAPSLTVSRQTHSAANSYFPLLQCDNICSIGQWLAVQEGGTIIPWQQRHQQNQSPDRRIVGYSAAA